MKFDIPKAVGFFLISVFSVSFFTLIVLLFSEGAKAFGFSKNMEIGILITSTIAICSLFYGIKK